MKEDILNLLNEALPHIDFTSSNTLVDDGILDSLSIASMLLELSMEYDVTFDMEKLLPENLNSIDAIVETVKSLQNKK